MPEPLDNAPGLFLIGAIMTFIATPAPRRVPRGALQEIAIARRNHAVRFRDKALGLAPARR